MTTTRATALTAPPMTGPAAVDTTAERLYAAEVALHHARQTHVDTWIVAAYDRLHIAIAEYLAAAAR